MLEAVEARLSEAVAAGLGEKDWSILADYTLRQQPQRGIDRAGTASGDDDAGS